MQKLTGFIFVFTLVFSPALAEAVINLILN